MVNFGVISQVESCNALTQYDGINLSNLGSYIKSVNNIPLLSELEEAHFFKEYKIFGNVEAARSLVMAHLKLVVKIAKEHSGYGLPQEDLIQEGNVGLMLAVKNFDPDHGVRLASYAAIWIKSEIQEYILSNWRLVKIGATKGLRKLFFNLRRLQRELHGQSKLEQKVEIAKILGVEESEVDRAIGWFSGGDIKLVSQSDMMDNNGDSFISELLVIEDGSLPEALVDEKKRHTNLPLMLKAAMACLNERESQVISRRFLADNPSTLGDISLDMGLSIERVRQIEVSALKKIKKNSPSLKEYID